MTLRRRDRPAARTFVWLSHLAAALALVAALAAGSWADLAAAAPPFEVVPGVAAPICHARSRTEAPLSAGGHACCDACVLAGVAVPPAGPQAPARVSRHIATHLVAATTALVARPREPRQARAPPDWA